jgi:hypothetical protein
MVQVGVVESNHAAEVDACGRMFSEREQDESEDPVAYCQDQRIAGLLSQAKSLFCELARFVVFGLTKVEDGQPSQDPPQLSCLPRLST